VKKEDAKKFLAEKGELTGIHINDLTYDLKNDPRTLEAIDLLGKEEAQDIIIGAFFKEIGIVMAKDERDHTLKILGLKIKQ
jgi:hypothetical protein